MLTIPSHIIYILTIGQVVLALPRKSESQAVSNLFLLYDFGMCRHWFGPGTSRSRSRYSSFYFTMSTPRQWCSSKILLTKTPFDTLRLSFASCRTVLEVNTTSDGIFKCSVVLIKNAKLGRYEAKVEHTKGKIHC